MIDIEKTLLISGGILIIGAFMGVIFSAVFLEDLPESHGIMGYLLFIGLCLAILGFIIELLT